MVLQALAVKLEKAATRIDGGELLKIPQSICLLHQPGAMQGEFTPGGFNHDGLPADYDVAIRATA